MSFASEEAVVMLLFVAKETEPWTPVSAGRRRRKGCYFTPELDLQLWLVIRDCEWAGTEGLASKFTFQIVWATSFCLFLC